MDADLSIICRWLRHGSRSYAALCESDGGGPVALNDCGPVELLAVGASRAPVAHLLAHISMLHGMLSDNLLPGAPSVYLPPPRASRLNGNFICLPHSSNYIGATLLLIVCFGGSYLFHRGVFGAFHFASFLPGAGPLFAVGIANAARQHRIYAYTFLGGLLFVCLRRTDDGKFR